MKSSSLLLVLMIAVVAGPSVAADLPTALELRLRTIESRLPEPGQLETLTNKVQRLAGTPGVAAPVSAGAAPAAGGDVLFSLYQKVQALTENVRQLRGDIEEIKHGIKQREQRQRDLYMDLSKRLEVLEQKLGVGDQAGGGFADAADGASGGGLAGSGSAGAGQAGAQQAYDAAFAQLSAGEVDKAGNSFEQFVHTYPYSEYTDNAWYWLGNARYIKREYDTALGALRHVIEDFPDSRKVPDSIYKIGVVLDEQGKFDQARATLERVIKQYPDSSAAQLAQQRLDAMGGG